MADKLLQRVAGATKQYTPVQASAGAADAGKVPALNSSGKIDSSMLEIASASRPVTASEALGAGKFVNLFSDAGTLKARLADNSNNRPAHGFVKVAASADTTATVFPLDTTNDALTGLTIGSVYFLGTAGGVISTPLDGADAGTAGFVDQKLGTAVSATELLTDDFDYVVL